MEKIDEASHTNYKSDVESVKGAEENLVSNEDFKEVQN